MYAKTIAKTRIRERKNAGNSAWDQGLFAWTCQILTRLKTFSYPRSMVLDITRTLTDLSKIKYLARIYILTRYCRHSVDLPLLRSNVLKLIVFRVAHHQRRSSTPSNFPHRLLPAPLFPLWIFFPLQLVYFLYLDVHPMCIVGRFCLNLYIYITSRSRHSFCFRSRPLRREALQQWIKWK